jgi:hypothetical protein
MDIYTYAYKTDSNQEILGSVHAECLDEAVAKIAIIKHLNETQILDLFTIQRAKL